MTAVGYVVSFFKKLIHFQIVYLQFIEIQFVYFNLILFIYSFFRCVGSSLL